VTVAAPWTGGFVRDRLHVSLGTDTSRSIVPVESLVGIALRRNPRRAQLLVSTVLAKHVPTVPGVAIAAGELLGLLVAGELDGGPSPAGAGERLASVLENRDAAALSTLRRDLSARRSVHPHVVTLGYAETATGLGHLVASAIGSPYLHSTRHAPDGGVAFAGFQEEHSHATDHQLYPTDPDWLKPGGTVVLVDDELSTGTTIVNTITALQAAVPQARWIVASLIDLRSPADRARFDALAATLATRISVVALGAGSIVLPDGVLDRAAEVMATLPDYEAVPSSPLPVAAGPVAVVESAAVPSTRGPVGAQLPSREGAAGAVREIGREIGRVEFVEPGVEPVRSARFGVDGVLDPHLASRIADAVAPHAHGETLVLGSEEFIALPMTVADALDSARGDTRFSTTTRSPIAPLDRPDYPIASVVRFRSHDLTPDGFGPRFAYNLTRAGHRFDTVVFMPEPGADRALLLAPGGVVEALRPVTGTVVVVLLPEATPPPTDWTHRP
jgi:hypothetical protein